MGLLERREGRHRGNRCEPAAGGYVEAWDGVGQVAVPDRAVVVRPHFVRD
jgi:hypothetical protein